MKKIIAVAVLLLHLISCQKALLPKPTNNVPINNFDALWNGFDQWYGTFEQRHVNWDSLRQVYRPQVHNDMRPEELYTVLCQLITPLNDIHAFIQPTTHGLPRYESSVFFRNNKVQRDFSIGLVQKKYLPTLTKVDEHVHYGILPGNIGYLHFGEFGMPLKFYQQQMLVIMQQLKDTRGMIVDIRNHGGGDDQVSRYIAGWFAAEEKLFMTVRKRNGPARTDFSTPQHWYVNKQGNAQYTKPVVLLTTRWTASAGETFTWAMNTQPHVAHMGDTTAGGFTDVIARELPNGWLYFVGVGDYRNAKGESKEGIGVAPAIYSVNTKEDIAAEQDKVLEAALSRF